MSYGPIQPPSIRPLEETCGPNCQRDGAVGHCIGVASFITHDSMGQGEKLEGQRVSRGWIVGGGGGGVAEGPSTKSRWHGSDTVLLSRAYMERAAAYQGDHSEHAG